MAAIFKNILLAILQKVIMQLIGATNWKEIFSAVVETAFDKTISKENKYAVAFARIEAAVKQLKSKAVAP